VSLKLLTILLIKKKSCSWGVDGAFVPWAMFPLRTVSGPRGGLLGKRGLVAALHCQARGLARAICTAARARDSHAARREVRGRSRLTFFRVFSPFAFREMFGMPNTPQGKRCRRPGGCRRSRFAPASGPAASPGRRLRRPGNGITRVIARVGKLPWAGAACMPRVLRGAAHQLSDGVAGRALDAAAAVRHQLQPSGSGLRAGFPEQPARRHDLVRGRQRGHRGQRRGGAVQTARGGRPGGRAAARPSAISRSRRRQHARCRAIVAPFWITCGRCLAGKGRSGPSLLSGRGQL